MSFRTGRCEARKMENRGRTEGWVGRKTDLTQSAQRKSTEVAEKSAGKEASATFGNRCNTSGLGFIEEA